MSETEIQKAIDRFLDGIQGNEPADMFIKKLRAVAGSLSHSEQAAKKARQRMFSMISMFGLPSLLFTITPDDSMNYRIRIMSYAKDGCDDPPNLNVDDNVLKEFVVSCANIRTNYPGFCAFDFENVISITVHELLGWDIKKGKNIEGKGIFGDLDGYCYAVEEQSRKTLHCHMLCFIKNWNTVLDGLADLSKRDQYAEAMKNYASNIMTCEFHSLEFLSCECGNVLSNHTKCTDQDLRNLRSQHATTSFGKKSILRCNDCQIGYSSNELAAMKVHSMFRDYLGNESVEFDTDSLWFKKSVRCKKQALMELHLMKYYMKQSKENFVAEKNSTEYKNAKSVMTALFNLHSCDHCVNCFNKTGECRMKIPNKECLKSEVQFQEDYVHWFSWNGKRIDKNLFIYSAERKHEDAFVNIHNEVSSMVFGCNTNVATCLDGGSIMYISCYATKSTDKDDKRQQR